MAIYHFAAKVISRGTGSSAVAAAAYRSASRLYDERIERTHNFTSKAGVVHSEILLPEGAPERWSDRATLWNEVEAAELRKDAQLAREVEFALPREMPQREAVELARSFVQREFVSKGMVADLNVHWDIGKDGQPKPHAHVMLTLREAGPDGFGAKVRDWNRTNALGKWREAWSADINRRLKQLGIEAQVDHRTLKAQGIELEPQSKIGPAAARKDGRAEWSERAEDHRAIAARNGERIIAEPKIALDAIGRHQSTFTDHDLARFVHRYTDGKEQFDAALAAVRGSSEVVRLGRDGLGRERFTSREMLGVEQRMETAAMSLGRARSHGVNEGARERALRLAERGGLKLSAEQAGAFRHVTERRAMSVVIGYAGTGKSAMLGVAKAAWEASGYQVRGAALSGMAAENLEAGSGIASRTLASLEHGWEQGRDPLTSRDVLVIDEAGLVGSRQMERVLGKAEAAGAKVVLVGDPEQLQAIEAGAAFRAIAERQGSVELTQVRRQQVDWQRAATRLLATERTSQALAAYHASGMVRAHADSAAATRALVAGWDRSRVEHVGASQVMLAYRRADVAELNRLARERMREAGALGEDQAISTANGERKFAGGDRVMFLRNERSLGVKNGSLGEVRAVDQSSLIVQLDGGRRVAVELKDYNHLDHGYASTIHKSQGVTVDRAHVLASAHMDRHATYVALSRHRLEVTLHYDRGTFVDRRALESALSRERAKDTTLDYGSRRGIEQSKEAGGAAFASFRPRADQLQRAEPPREAQLGRGAPAIQQQQHQLQPERQLSLDGPGAVRRGKDLGLEL